MYILERKKIKEEWGFCFVGRERGGAQLKIMLRRLKCFSLLFFLYLIKKKSKTIQTYHTL